jgi:pyroglutamyl-peptidase
MEKRLLITGFDPFGGESINPAWEAVKRLPDMVGEYVLCKLQIPTVFSLAGEQVLNEAARIQPDTILCIGQAGGRSAITPERIAVNIRDARIADNEGNQPRGEFVAPDGPAAYFATVPVLKMADAMEAAGIPATVSNSAGAFVCNDTLYGILHHFAGSSVRCGFIHVPFIPEQGEPNMELENIVKALEIAICACGE